MRVVPQTTLFRQLRQMLDGVQESGSKVSHIEVTMGEAHQLDREMAADPYWVSLVDSRRRGDAVSLNGFKVQIV